MNEINFTPFPTLQTPQYTLRRLESTDVHEIFALRSNPEVNKYLERPAAKTLDDAYEYINKIHKGIAKNEWMFWAIIHKNSSRLLGTICLWNMSIAEGKADVGYELLPENQGKGIMREALKAVLDYAFTVLCFPTIEAEVAPKNEKSIKLLECNKFELREKHAGDAENEKTYIYSLTKKDYLTDK